MKREEAIEVIKELQPNDRLREALRTLIPELAESEDEIIRKKILAEYKDRLAIASIEYKNPLCNKEIVDFLEKAIAYLEKQKEQIVIKQNIIDSIRANTQPDWDFSTIPNLHEEINRFFGEKFILPHTEDTIITVSDVIRCAYHFYNFGKHEQKPAEWNEEDRVMLNNIIWGIHMKSIGPLDEMDDRSKYKKYENFLKSLPERFNLQPKQEWSAEDERMLSRCIKSIESSKNFAETQTFKEAKDKEKEWLILLPERFNLQQKQEWSDEDEKMLWGFTAWIPEEELAKHNITRNSILEKLKSIRPQPHWKPSEEQMKFLKRIVNGYDITCRGQVELESLYKDLKKLM